MNSSLRNLSEDNNDINEYVEKQQRLFLTGTEHQTSQPTPDLMRQNNGLLSSI